MYDILAGMKVIELSAFIAAPLAGLTLSQLGAEVIRIDPPGGGMDYKRWPLTDEGTSLYWTGLNKGKRSVCLDLKQEEEREVFKKLLASSGEDGGILLTNLTGPSWLQYDELCKVRPDLIMVSLTGHHDGATAVDYTVNSAVGIPFATGEATLDKPVNNMLPAWDAIAGMTLATGLLAAERHRNKTGEGQHVKLALSDVAYSLVSNLGITGEVEVLNRERPAIGNHLYGAFGHNLPTSDDRQLMVIVLTNRHWNSLLEVTQTHDEMQRIAEETGQDLNEDAGRYAAREEILSVLKAWSCNKTLKETGILFDAHKILWGPYQTFSQMMKEDPRASTFNPMMQEINQPGVGRLRAAGSPLDFSALSRSCVKPAPEMGRDTQTVLDEISNDE